LPGKNLDATELDPYYSHQKPRYQSFIRIVEDLQCRYGQLTDQLSANGKSIRQQFLLPESVTPSVDAGCKSLISICFSKIAGAPIGSPQFLGSK
jgi:hypothetical protein